MRLSTFLVAGALAAAPCFSTAQVSVNINVPGLVTIAPPAPRYERAPPPRAGQVWVPGHWQWQQDDYAWQQGRWQAARPDYDYAPGRWVRAGDGWRWAEPEWRRAKHPKHKDKHYGTGRSITMAYRHDRHEERDQTATAATTALQDRPRRDAAERCFSGARDLSMQMAGFSCRLFLAAKHVRTFRDARPSRRC